jgi:hypothetical protein
MARRDSGGDAAAEAGRAALIELIEILRECRRGVVVVGGWVPHLLFPDADEPPVSTIDVDLALHPQRRQQVRRSSVGQWLDRHRCGVAGSGALSRGVRGGVPGSPGQLLSSRVAAVERAVSGCK